MDGMERVDLQLAGGAGPLVPRSFKPLVSPAPSLPLRRGRRGRDGPSETEVAEHQRARLTGALITEISEHGYDGLRLRALCDASGVSKRHFYLHYKSLHDCYMAAFAQITDAFADRLVDAWMSGHGPQERLSLAVQCFAQSVAQEPGAARLVLCASSAAGQAAVRARLAFDARLEELLLAGLQAYGLRPSPVVVQAMFAGLSTVVRARLNDGREGELRELSTELGRWAWCCLSAPAPQDRAGRGAPLCFSPSAHLLAKAGRADEPARVRILAATLEQAAEHGCGAVQERAIRQRAHVGCEEFRAHFEDCYDALATVLAEMWGETLKHAIAVARTVHEWPHGVPAAIRTLLASLAADELFVRLAITELPALDGARGERERLRMILAVARMLHRRMPSTARPSITATEASVAAAWETIRAHTASGERHGLLALAPTLAYLALAPGIGVEAAAEAVSSRPARSAAAVRPGAEVAGGQRGASTASHIR